MDFESNLYAASGRIWLQCRNYAAFAVVSELAMAVLRLTTDLGAALIFFSILIWSYLAYAAHAAVLLPTPQDLTAVSGRVVGFALRTALLFFVAFFPFLFLVAFVATEARPARDPEILTGLALLFGMPLLGLASMLVLCLAGTLLPAYVADRGRGLGAALSRARRQFFWTLGRMLIGPAIAYAGFMALLFLAPVLLGSDGVLLDESYVPDPALVVVLVAAFTVQSYAVVMVAVVLSRAFLREESAAST